MVMLETLQKQIADGTYTMTNKTLTNPTVNFTDKTISTNVKCRAYLNTEQSNVTDDTWTKILLDAETYDIGSNFDTTNKRFVAPVTGFYLVTSGVEWSTVADKVYELGIYVNGSLYSRSRALSSASSSVVLSLSDIVYCPQGQYIELYAKHTSGGTTPDIRAGNTDTFMAIHLLSI